MTKTAALYNFFSQFGVNAYPSNNTPGKLVFPYLTYEVAISGFLEGETAIVVNLWYYTTREDIPNAKVEEISKAIGLGGKTIRCDEGIIWIKKGSPFCKSLKDENEGTVKRRVINLSLEFLTE